MMFCLGYSNKYINNLQIWLHLQILFARRLFVVCSKKGNRSFFPVCLNTRLVESIIILPVLVVLAVRWCSLKERRCTWQVGSLGLLSSLFMHSAHYVLDSDVCSRLYFTRKEIVLTSAYVNKIKALIKQLLFL